MTHRNRKLSFVINELGLAVSSKQIASELAAEIGVALKLKRFYPGHGWGLKYLAFRQGAIAPFAVIKASSSIIERRLRVKLAERYVIPSRRFALEAEVLDRLAALDLGPKVLLCREQFFVREYLDGTALAELPLKEIAARLPDVLDSIERACGEGVFHTDLNAGNVIVRPDNRVGFIDCEVPAGNSSTDPHRERDRKYCHERLLHSLAKTAGNDSLLADAAEEYYQRADNPPISPDRAKNLVSESDISIEVPL